MREFTLKQRAALEALMWAAVLGLLLFLVSCAQFSQAVRNVTNPELVPQTFAEALKLQTDILLATRMTLRQVQVRGAMPEARIQDYNNKLDVVNEKLRLANRLWDSGSEAPAQLSLDEAAALLLLLEQELKAYGQNSSSVDPRDSSPYYGDSIFAEPFDASSSYSLRVCPDACGRKATHSRGHNESVGA